MLNYEQEFNNRKNYIFQKLVDSLDDSLSELSWLIDRVNEVAENYSPLIDGISDLGAFLRDNAQKENEVKKDDTIDKQIEYYSEKLKNYFQPLQNQLDNLRIETSFLYDADDVPAKFQCYDVLIADYIKHFGYELEHKLISDTFTGESGQLMGKEEILSHFKDPEYIGSDNYRSYCPVHNGTEKDLVFVFKESRMVLSCEKGCNLSEILKKLSKK